MARSSTFSWKLVDRYFTEIRKTPHLSRDQERELSQRIGDGCEASVHDLVTPNLAFVAKVAHEYRNLGVSYEDLLSEGNLGLIEAAKRFDGRRGVRFLTYAYWWIRKSIVEALNTQSSTVQIPHRMRRETQAASGATTRRRFNYHASATEDPISGKIRARRADAWMLSLDDGGSEGQSLRWHETLPDGREPSAESRLIRRETLARLQDLLPELSDEERFVIERRFGLDGQPPQTLQTVSEQMKVTREWVRQIELRATRKLGRSLGLPSWRRRRAMGVAPRKVAEVAM